MAEIELHPDFKDFLRLLNSHAVEYLLVGGYAVGATVIPVRPEIWTSSRHKDLEDLEHLPYNWMYSTRNSAPLEKRLAKAQ